MGDSEVENVFVLTIPLGAAPEVPVENKPEEAPDSLIDRVDESRAILVVEDNAEMRLFIEKQLYKQGYKVYSASNGAEALQVLAGQDIDLIITDLMMPKMNGVEVLQKLRAEGIKTPIMMLTAKAEKDDRITGFNAGADDYLPKPFEPDELIARVRAMLRRSEDYHPTLLTWGDITLNPDTGVLSCGRESVRLSGREFQVMELFMRSPKVVLSADRIMERVWGWDSDAEINVVWVHISNLRKKIKSIGSGVTITANRGMGYLLEETK